MSKGSPTITIRITSEMLTRLQACAEDLYASTSEIVRAALDEYLAGMGYRR